MKKKKAPILVLGTKADFSLYTCEILKAEGLNGFDLRLMPEDKITWTNIYRFARLEIDLSRCSREAFEAISREFYMLTDEK